MEGRNQDAMACSEFEALLSEALDGTLNDAARQRFEAHKSGCAVCRQTFTEVEAGMNWMEALPEVEPPARLLHGILAETTGKAEHLVPAAERSGWWQQVRQWMRPVLEPAMQPRFAMSAATAFFSVTLVLNVAGFRIGDVKGSDLRPSTVIAGISQFAGETQGRLVKYYENLRFVYEIETRVRQLKNATDQNTQPDDSKQKQKDKKPKDDNTSGQPQRQEERYSLGFGEGILASVAAPWNYDSVWAVLDRRNP
jgi:Putative zinc-finger